MPAARKTPGRWQAAGHDIDRRTRRGDAGDIEERTSTMARPLKYDAAMPRDAASYKREARQALKARGGRMLSVQLEAQALADLEASRRPGESDAGVITRALRRVQGMDL